MEHDNRILSMLFAIVAALLISVMLILSFSQSGFSSSKPVYIFGIVFSMIQILISIAAKKHPVFSYISVYTAVSVFLVYGIAIATLTRPEEATVTFMVMLIFVPLIFVDRPLRMAIFLCCYIILFIVMACGTKPPEVLSVDIADAVIFGLLSIVSESVVYRAKIRGYVLENRLHAMSETDQLTGLNNRNCYELRREGYSSLYKDSIACVYMDVNGLHELNNSRGHSAGDEMLRFIANELVEQFGRTDSYRVGGDEYVTFVLDTKEEEIREKIAVLMQRITEKGYHAAIGCEYRDQKNADIDKLVVAAESRMYQSKSEYYKDHDRRTR